MNPVDQHPAPESRADTAPVRLARPLAWVDALAALSFGNLCLGIAWTDLLDRGQFGYFHKQPVLRVQLLAVVLNVALVASIAWLALRAWRRAPRGRWQRLGAVMFLLSLAVPVEFVRTAVFHLTDHEFVSGARHPLSLAAIAGAVAGAWLWPVAAVGLLRRLLLTLSPLCVFSLGRALLLLMGVLRLEAWPADPPLARTLPTPPDAPQVLWLLFDELDYRLVFPERPAGLELPEFDRLSREALSATNAQRPGSDTVISLPALTTGERVVEATPTGPAELTLTLADGRKTNWTALPTIFAQVRALGLNSSLVGWYHPYRRLFGTQLSACEWFSFPFYDHVGGASLAAALGRQLAAALPLFNLRYLNVRLHQEILAAALSVTTNSASGLTFLHLPVPHGPGVYRADSRRYTIWGLGKVSGYLNSLVLADRTLRELRQALEQAGRWDRTWLIVSTDHNWRYSAAFDGQVDERVPFMVRPPGQRTGQTFGEKINTRVTAALVLAILRREVHDAADLAAWLDTHAVGWDAQGPAVSPAE